MRTYTVTYRKKGEHEDKIITINTNGSTYQFYELIKMTDEALRAEGLTEKEITELTSIQIVSLIITDEEIQKFKGTVEVTKDWGHSVIGH